MISRNETFLSSCPNCEYNYGHSGQPVLHANGTTACNICNSKWHDLNSAQNTGRKLQISVEQVKLVHTPASNNIQQIEPVRENKLSLSHIASSILVLGGLIILVFNFTYEISLPGDFTQQKQIPSTSLTLDNIKVENHKNNKARYWTITARITNHSIHSVAVPPVLMSSGDKGSSGYFGWTYRPALQKLAPGTNLIIRTSIQKPAGTSGNIELKFAADNSKSG